VTKEPALTHSNAIGPDSTNASISGYKSKLALRFLRHRVSAAAGRFEKTDHWRVSHMMQLRLSV
jgi:hypothetical protein